MKGKEISAVGLTSIVCRRSSQYPVYIYLFVAFQKIRIIECS